MTFDNIGYYIYNSAVVLIKSIDYPVDEENMAKTVAEFDWDSCDENGNSYKDIVKKSAADDLISDVAFRQMAEKSGISISEEKNNAEKLINEAIEESGETKILNNAAHLGISTISEYKEVYTNISIFEKIAKDFYYNPTKYIDDTDVLYDYKSDRGATALSILILNDNGKSDIECEDMARHIASEAKSGSDFSELMRMYNQDDSEEECGYTFPIGEMQNSFEKAVFSLELDETSHAVASDYGYYILKRIAGAYEMREYVKATADIEINDEAINQLDNEFYRVISRIASSL